MKYIRWKLWNVSYLKEREENNNIVGFKFKKKNIYFFKLCINTWSHFFEGVDGYKK